jgi:Carboxypeptidase regulatory-like domain
MEGNMSRECDRNRIEIWLERKTTVSWFAAVFLGMLFAVQANGQSTFGAILGTVKDGSGQCVVGATVSIVNRDTVTKRMIASDQAGDYSFPNLEPGQYELTIEAPGFQTTQFKNLDLQVRETKRVDAALKVATQTQTILVEGSMGAVVTTDVSSLTETKTTRELVDLPVALESRADGSTSPISTLTTQPGIQTDSSGALAIAGATPALLSYTLDGIASVNVELSGPIAELFPSFNSIAEIHVNETNNNAEFSGVSDVSTTSRSGSNVFHGGFFENHGNSAFNAGNPFTGKPKLVMNDFGGFLGGPLILPKLYNGKDKTFLFMSYEGLRLPKEVPIVQSVPSRAMRSGNLCSYMANQGVTQIRQPDGTPIPCDSVPVSPLAANVLNYLFPVANTGGPDDYANNFTTNFPTPISSNQADLRLDQRLTSKQNIYARVSYKNRQVTAAPGDPNRWYSSCSVLCGPLSNPEQDAGLTVAHNYAISPAVFNEVRAGFNGMHTSANISGNNQTLLDNLGLVMPPGVPLPPATSVPNFSILGFQSTGGVNPFLQKSLIFQILDNVTWTKGKHTFKFGGDFRRMSDHDDNVFGSWRFGQFGFNGSSNVESTIGDPYAAFLLGYPDYTYFAQVVNPNMNGLGYSYAVFAQDDWKISSTLTLNIGLRYEIHPPLRDVQGNTADFLPDWSGTLNGQPVQGAVVIPNDSAQQWTNPAFVSSIAPTPILTAKQAGIPEKLRYTDKTDFGPRIGFAWRPFHDNKTVVRGGYGRFISAPLGFSLLSGWAVSSSSVQFFGNDYDSSGNPILSYPSPFPPNLNSSGGQSFYYAFPVKYKDPTVMQWNVSFERDLGFNTGLRLSYVGSHGSHLETMVDLNQVHPNTTGYSNQTLPFPLWGVIQSVYNGAESNYNAMTVEVHKRFSNGLQFQSSYAFTRDLSDEAGAAPAGFVGAGGSWVTDRFHLGLDYGNVAYDRRHRFLTTYLYDLPFGRGKKLLSNSNGFVNALAGGWEVAGVVLVQTGPFLTPSEASTDPSGTNMINVVGLTRPDIVAGVSPYGDRSTSNYLNAAAWSIPSDNIGRFGNAPVGQVVGPGTSAVSLSLMKSFAIRESAKFQFGAQIANLFNHRNYDVPNMGLDTDGFGTITSLQKAEGAGPRAMQLTARISF